MPPTLGESDSAAAAFATTDIDPIAEGLRAMAEEPQSGVASADRPSLSLGKRIGSLLSRLKGAIPSMPHVSMPNIPRPDLSGARERAEQLVAGVREKIPEMHMPNVSMPDLSAVGEAIDSNKVGGFLKRSIENYLKKFDPRGKDKKAWALGIAAGAGSVVAAAEFGATLGFSPAIRGLAVFAILHTSDFMYGRLHNAYLARATGSSMIGAVGSFVGIGGDSKTADFRKQVVGLEKTVAAKGLKDQAFIDAYREELSNLRRQSFDAIDPSIINDTGLSEDQINKLLKLGTDYAVVNATARSLAAGMSAGSFIGAMGEVGIRSLFKGSLVRALSENYTAPQVQIPSVQMSEITLPQMPEVTLPQMPQVEIPNVELQHLEMPHADLPSVPHAPDSLPDLTDKITSIEATPEYQTGIAAEVGKYLPARDEIVSEALKAKGILPAEIDTSSFDAGREAALHVMEGKGNEIFDAAVKHALSVDPNADLSQVTEEAQKAYADWLASEVGHTQIAEAAQNVIADHLQIEDALAQKVVGGLEASQDWVKDVPLEHGVTAGKILDLTWTPADAPVMGANIAANYDTLTEMWGQMAKSSPELLSGTNFPVSLSELNDLVARAEAGDELAIRKLRLALHWIPAGSKFRAVAASASREVLKLVA